jgi:hypothetical protein
MNGQTILVTIMAAFFAAAIGIFLEVSRQPAVTAPARQPSALLYYPR